jgi:hypothetical protein
VQASVFVMVALLVLVVRAVQGNANAMNRTSTDAPVAA